MNRFSIKCGKLAIGDPTMGMVVVDFPDSGEFTLQQGALFPAQDDVPVIALDSPGLFVVDAEFLSEFEEWYHKVGAETYYALHLLEERTDEISRKLGSEVAFYWEEELSGASKEERYQFDPTKVQNCT